MELCQFGRQDVMAESLCMNILPYIIQVFIRDMKEKDIKESNKATQKQNEATQKQNEADQQQNEASAQKKNCKAQKKAEKSAQEIDTLKSRIETLEASLAKEKDDYIRLMAEFENFRRRTAAERLELISTASEKIILELLPTLDDCERAMKALGESTDSAAAKEGTELIYNKLLAALKAKGLKEIDAQDKPFDTEVMEAVAQFPVQEEEKKGKVFDVVQKGYTLGEKVIRYAKVVVGQ